MSSSTSATRNKPPNSTDPGWDYGEMVGSDKNAVKCDFCQLITNGGVHRHKRHLTGGYKDVRDCTSVPKEVKELLIKHFADEKEKRDARNKIKRTSISGTNINKSSKQNDIVEKEEEVNELAAGGKSGAGSTTSESSSQSIGPKRPKHKGPLAIMLPPKFDKLVESPLDNNVHRKKARDDTCEFIGDFFYENGISFDCAKSPSFVKMIAEVGQFGEGLKPPSYNELTVTILQKKVKAIKDWIDGFKAHWEYYGCSIMTDWWTDGKNRTLINFLVNCPKGTVFLKSIDGSQYAKDAKLVFGMLKDVIEEVGEKNVVQVVTNNESNYKLAEKWLKEEKPIFWTPCAAHCVNLMCQDISNLPKIVNVMKESRSISVFMYSHTDVLHMMRKLINGSDLVRSAVTRFATSFLSMESIFDKKSGLRTMMISEEWMTSEWAKNSEGKRIAKIIKSSSYWDNLQFALKILAPLVEVIRLVDMEEQPCMGYIYRAMEDCKKKLEADLGPSEKVLCNKLHRIIDHRWVEQLRQPLHAAGYYLNPSIYFDAPSSRSQVEANSEVKTGAYTAINTLVVHEDECERVFNQLVLYREASGMMGTPMAIKQRKTLSPGQWWIAWGSDAPDLQKFAKRVFSLICVASPCVRNWSAFSNLLSKKRNRLEHQKLNDLVFVQYNCKLKARYEDRISLTGRDTDPIILKGLDECQEWTDPYDAADDVVGDTDLTCRLVEEAEGEDHGVPITSMRQYKRKRVKQEREIPK